MSIRARILIPMVVMLILSASAILFINSMQFTAFSDDYIESELNRAILKVTDEIEWLKTKSRIAALYCANDNALIAAMENDDRDATIKRAKELFDQTDVESISVVDEYGIVLARGHNAGLYGDDSSGMSIVQSALNNETVISAENGVSTKLSVRAALPVHNSNGEIIGALFVGDRLDTESFVDRLKTFTGCEISVYVDDIRVATTLLNQEGSRATGLLLKNHTENVLQAGDNITKHKDAFGHEIAKKHTLIYNSDGKITGVVSAGKSLDEKRAMVSSFISTGILIGGAFILLSTVVLIFVSRQIATPIKQTIDRWRYDETTGLYNRRSLDEYMVSLFKLLSRTNGLISVLMIDIDFFKLFNDTYGHVKGDECLRAVADVLTATVSRSGDMVARFGGEEFLIVLPHADEEGARNIAKRLLEGVQRLGIRHEKSDAHEFVTISIGVTTGRVSKSASYTGFIEKADAMLYESKRKGRNTYTFAPIK